MAFYAVTGVVKQLALSAAMILSAGDASRGAVVYRETCGSCHGATGKGGVALGPTLVGVLGRRAGAAPGFRGSRALRAAGESGIIWSATNLDRYLAWTAKVVPHTIMTLRTPSVEDREDVIAFLATLAPSSSKAPPRAFR